MTPHCRQTCILILQSDIILSPLKPDQKNLTATDVTSSLYYIHLNLPSDVALLSPEQQTKAVPEPHIARKPIPASAASDAAAYSELDALNQSRIAFLDGNGSSNIGTPKVTPPPTLYDGRKSAECVQRIARRPVSSSDGPEKTTENAASVTRRLLGPRSIAGGPSFAAADSLLSREQTRYTSGQSMFNVNSRTASNELPPAADKVHSLTLIRRDIASGAQWNIGFIEVMKVSKHTKTSQPGQPDENDCKISIKLTTPGYNQFTPTPMQGFHRDVTTEYAGFWDYAFRRHQRGTSTSSLGHSRGNSDGSNFSAENAGSQGSPTKSSKAKMKTYTMLSPWNGRCEFSTGGGGRSLRCRHTLSSNVAAQQHDYERNDSVTVSEMRYNLPSADLFKMPPEAKEAMKKSAAATAKTLKRTSQMVKGWQIKIRERSSSDIGKPTLPPRPSESEVEVRPALPPRPPSTSYAAQYGSDDDEWADEGELDLSLGREKAGGGNRGKRAKLGKLIIFDEGFKMLDLIVAANMGVWWAGWEV